MQKPLKVALLTTGNEILAGELTDTNAQFFAEQCQSLGLPLYKKMTLGDDLAALTQTIEELSKEADLLLINGGLGPTEDDYTSRALSQATKQPLIKNAVADQHLQSWCKKLGILLNTANQKQAWLPEKAKIIPNPVGSAVGFWLKHHNCSIFCTPGVPKEMKAMWSAWLQPHLQKLSSIKIHMLRFRSFGLGESNLQNLLGKALPDNTNLGFRAHSPYVDIKILCQSEDQIKELTPQVQSLLGSYAWVGTQDLAWIVHKLLLKNNAKLCCAESCSGGRLALSIVELATASKIFEMGWVCYSDLAKHQQLKISLDLLNTAGAVSAPVVHSMAQQALALSGADWVVSTSGIAGPSGGTHLKPVGTVWVCWGSRQGLQARRLQISGDRKQFQHKTACIGLDFLRRELLGLNNIPKYSFDKLHILV